VRAPGGLARVAAYNACNERQYNDHLAECRRHYPATCPFKIAGPFGTTLNDPIQCPQWLIEKTTCFMLADVYFRGVTAAGIGAYIERQNEYCTSP